LYERKSLFYNKEEFRNEVEAFVIMIRKYRFIWALLCMFLLLSLPNNNVSAHAYVTNSNPGENEILDTPPDNVTIEFNEKIQSGFASIHVLNSSGERVDENNLHINEKTNKSMTVDLKDDLPNDIYTTEWKVVSADGHTISGIIPFSIGELPEGVSFPEQQNTGTMSTIVSTVFNRGFLYIGFSLYMGIMLFYLAWYRSKELSEKLINRTKKTAKISFILLALSILSFLFIQTASYSGGSFLEGIKPKNLLVTLQSTKEGKIWIIQLLLFIVLCISNMYVLKKNSLLIKKMWIIPSLAFIGIILVKAFSGHPSSSPYESLAITLDFFHMLAASIWLGGMIVIILFLREGVFAKEGKGHDLYWGTLDKYSVWALFSVAVLVISGAINASLLIPDFHSLVSTTYGITLLVKVGLLLFMLGFGCYHLIHRKLLNKQEFYKKSIKLEMSIGILVLIITSIFTQIQTPTLPIDKPFYGEAELGYNENISLSISPKKTGIQNQYEINVFDNNRKTIDPIEQVTISLSKDGKEISFTLDREKEGYYLNRNLLLNQPGNWKIEVHVLTKDLESYELPFTMQVR